MCNKKTFLCIFIKLSIHWEKHQDMPNMPCMHLHIPKTIQSNVVLGCTSLNPQNMNSASYTWPNGVSSTASIIFHSFLKHFVFCCKLHFIVFSERTYLWIINIEDQQTRLLKYHIPFQTERCKKSFYNVLNRWHHVESESS